MNGNKRAQLASDMLNYQIKKTIGSYIAAMGGVDAIVFTGGIGEHDADSRAKICHHMDWLGIRIDTDKNRDAHKQKTAYAISACLVGSEMCIRDSRSLHGQQHHARRCRR